MSSYNPEVKIALDKLCDLKSAVDCLSIVREERDKAKAATAEANEECAEAICKMKAEINAANEAAEKKNAELLKVCETQAQEINQLRCRIMEAEKNLAAWEQAANADKPEADALAYLKEHDTPFENECTEKACDVIRALLKKKVDAPVGSDNAEGLS